MLIQALIGFACGPIWSSNKVFVFEDRLSGSRFLVVLLHCFKKPHNGHVYFLKSAENFWVLTHTLILQCHHVSTVPVPTCPPSPFTGENPEK